jgi:hypothetical protein
MGGEQTWRAMQKERANSTERAVEVMKTLSVSFHQSSLNFSDLEDTGIISLLSKYFRTSSTTEKLTK